MQKQPCLLTASEAADAIRAGTLTSEALIRSCLERIEERDADVKAWLHIDKRKAVAAAREVDKRPSMGPLHGLPIGVKDMIDTADMPTTYNSPLFQEFQPSRDAACVAVARASGAVILGKTDTAEFAAGGRHAITRNPRNFAFTPGGSSSGSSAAVADRQVQLAFGTQTGGSLIRPASFNGIYALKPTWGAVSPEGAKHCSYTLDTVGWYGRSVADLALVATAFRLFDIGNVSPPDISSLRIAYCRTPFWENIEPAGEAALNLACERVAKAGAKVTELVLPKPFDKLADAMNLIMAAEGLPVFLPAALTFGDRLHADFRDRVENKTKVTPAQLVAAHDVAAECRPAFEQLCSEFDAVLTPSAPGEPPHTGQGNHILNGLWTLLRVPCLAIPCTTGPNGLPVGIQFVSPRYSDARLLAIGEALSPVIDLETPQWKL